MSADVNALQLLPEIQNTEQAPAGGSDAGLIATCWDPTCIITYCATPLTVIG